MRPVALVLTLALVVLSAGCSDGPGEGGGRLVVDGLAVVRAPGEDPREVTGTTEVEVGDRIAVRTGTAVLEAGFGPVYELREGIGDADPTAITFDEVTVVERGDLLVVAAGTAAVEAAGTEVVVDGGAAQVSRFLGMGVRAYEGETTVDSAGQVRSLRALRSIEIGVLGSPPSRTPPLEYVGSDPWDRRYLGDAIAYGEELERKAVGLIQNRAAPGPVGAAFLRQVLPTLEREPSFVGELVDESRDPAELVAGAAIAAYGVQGTFTERWASVFAFRDEGAAWGLVALDQAVSQQPALNALEVAIGAELGFAEPPPTTTTTSAPSTSGIPPATTAPPPETPPATTTPPTDPPSTPPTTEPAEPPLVDLDPVVDPLTALLDTLIEGLLGDLLGQ